MDIEVSYAHMQRRAGNVERNVITARGYHHIPDLDVIDCNVSSTVLSRRCSTATGVELSASKVRHNL